MYVKLYKFLKEYFEFFLRDNYFVCMIKFFGGYGRLFWYLFRLKFDSFCEKGKNEVFVVFVEVVGVYVIFYKIYGIFVIF